MNVFNIKIDNLTMEQALEKIGQFLKLNKQHYIVLPYSEFIIRAQKDKEFKNILNKASLCLCESRGLYLTIKFLGISIKQEINGIELIYNICSKFQKIFLLGGADVVVRGVKQKLNGNIVGAENGYQDLSKIINKINKVKPEILLVGLGSPRQEKWIYDNLKNMPSVKVAIGTGGAFDFISGKIKRAPKFVQKSGTEWIWRLIVQPHRFGRISKGILGLGWLALKEKIKN